MDIPAATLSSPSLLSPRPKQRRKTLVSIELPTSSQAQPKIFKPGVPADDEKDTDDDDTGASDPLIRLDSRIKAFVDQLKKWEQQIKALDSQLVQQTQQSRNTDAKLRRTSADLQVRKQTLEKMVNKDMNKYDQQLTNSVSDLQELDDFLPDVRAKVEHIRQVYDSGREKARILSSELEWRSSPWSERAIKVLFTRSAPKATLDIAVYRLLFVLALLFCTWRLYVAVDGAYRAYRHGLVWGDKLIS